MLEHKVWVCPRCKAQLSSFLDGTLQILRTQHESKCAKSKYETLILTEEDRVWLKKILVSE